MSFIIHTALEVVAIKLSKGSTLEQLIFHSCNPLYNTSANAPSANSPNYETSIRVTINTSLVANTYGTSPQHITIKVFVIIIVVIQLS